MSPLAFLCVVLTIVAVASAALLTWKAFRRPWIGALAERAVVGDVIGVFGVVATRLVLNTESAEPSIDVDVARIIFRVSLLVLLGVPTVWTILYLTGRLGGRK